jgi:antitoxin PrlF
MEVRIMKKESKTEGLKKMSTTMEKIEATSKITSKGQITVPVEIRNALELKEGDHLRFIVKDGTVTVEPVIHTSIEDLFGIFNQPEDSGNFVLDLGLARESRANQVIKKYEEKSGGDSIEAGKFKERNLD